MANYTNGLTAVEEDSVLNLSMEELDPVVLEDYTNLDNFFKIGDFCCKNAASALTMFGLPPTLASQTSQSGFNLSIRILSQDKVIGHKILVEKLVPNRGGGMFQRRSRNQNNSVVWSDWEYIPVIFDNMESIGPTSSRPNMSSIPTYGLCFTYFDTTLGKPIFWSGSAWVDATGATV